MWVPIVGIPPKRHKITNKQQVPPCCNSERKVLLYKQLLSMELLPDLVSALANVRKWMAIKDNNVTCRNPSYV
jgi:hypothetical protein